jgi:hypothetical protein
MKQQDRWTLPLLLIVESDVVQIGQWHRFIYLSVMLKVRAKLQLLTAACSVIDTLARLHVQRMVLLPKTRAGR